MVQWEKKDVTHLFSQKKEIPSSFSKKKKEEEEELRRSSNMKQNFILWIRRYFLFSHCPAMIFFLTGKSNFYQPYYKRKNQQEAICVPQRTIRNIS